MKTGMLGAAMLAIGLLAACATNTGATWIKLVDNGRGLERFHRVGEANWSVIDGALQATAGGKTPAYLVTNGSFTDFTLRAEFWASDDANSGIFFRCQDPRKITDENCYEANIFDQRPDPTYGTGAIVKVAPLTAPMIRAGGKWNTMEITAQGRRLVVILNGTRTIDIEDRKFSSGPIALQWGRGTIRFRNVELRPHIEGGRAL